MSLIKDPETYEPFERVVLVHGVRQVAELAYEREIEHELRTHELLGEFTAEKLVYYPTVTREAFRNQGRVTDLMFGGGGGAVRGGPPGAGAHDRVMLCGSPGLLTDFGAWFEQGGWVEGTNTRQGEYVIEKAFVEK